MRVILIKDDKDRIPDYKLAPEDEFWTKFFLWVFAIFLYSLVFAGLYLLAGLILGYCFDIKLIPF